MKYLLIALLFIPMTFSQDEARVAIFDTGIKNPERFKICDNGLINATDDKTIKDHNGHGTNIASIISKTNHKKYCLVIIKIFNQEEQFFFSRYLYYLLKVIEMKVTHVNLSFESRYMKGFTEEEFMTIQILLNSGIKVSVAAGNGSINLDKFCVVFPACFSKIDPRLHAVGGRDLSFSNQGKFLYQESGLRKGNPSLSGTSQATAVHTRKLLDGLYD